MHVALFKRCSKILNSHVLWENITEDNSGKMFISLRFWPTRTRLKTVVIANTIKIFHHSFIGHALLFALFVPFLFVCL